MASKTVLLLILETVLLAAVAAPGVCQNAETMLALQESGATAPQPVHPEDTWRARMERDMAKKAIEQRHAALKRDTDKLLKLSTELKAYVDKAGEQTLSLEVVNKATEIEKLAHSVKEKMKGN